MTERAVWFHCFSGIAGDMALASLLDAGADLDTVNAGLSLLGIEGLAVAARPARRGSLLATAVQVSAEEDGTSRTLADISAIIAKAGLPGRVEERAQATFGALAETEAALHGFAPDEVHFHEVGGHDAIGDVVGTCLALEDLCVDRVFSSAVTVGTGTVAGAHGVLPNPAPATLRLLAGAPVVGCALEVEMTTPTGAALLAGLAALYGPIPTMSITSSGYGAGSAEIPGTPNCLQAVVGEISAARTEGPGQELMVIETNVDDTSGEVLQYTLARLMENGALDAWITPSTGKKGRPAHTVSLLTELGAAPALRQILVTETGSLGARAWPVARWAGERRIEDVTIEGMIVRVKVGSGTVKAENDDVAAVARATGMSHREVSRRAVEEWRGRSES